MTKERTFRITSQLFGPRTLSECFSKKRATSYLHHAFRNLFEIHTSFQSILFALYLQDPFRENNAFLTCLGLYKRNNHQEDILWLKLFSPVREIYEWLAIRSMKVFLSPWSFSSFSARVFFSFDPRLHRFQGRPRRRSSERQMRPASCRKQRCQRCHPRLVWPTSFSKQKGV